MIENQVFLMGRLARNNELQHFNKQGGGDFFVVNNTIAVQGKTKNESAIFVDFKAWNTTAKYLSDYTQKGDKIAIFGELECESWTDKNTGTQRSKLAVNVREAKVIYSQAQQMQGNNQGYNQAPQQDDLGYNQPLDDNEIPF